MTNPRQHPSCTDLTPPEQPQAVNRHFDMQTRPEREQPQIVEPGSGYFPGTDMFCRETSCLFARRAQLWNHRVAWDRHKSATENTEALRPELDKYIAHTYEALRAGRQPCDVFPIEAPGYLYGQDMDAFTCFVRVILTTINPQSVAALRDLKPTPAGHYADDGWLYSYGDIALFVVSTCALYGPDHGRYSGGEPQQHAIVQLQSLAGDLQSLAGVDHRLGQKGAALRQANITHFKTSGRDYYATQALVMGDRHGPKTTHEAPRFLKDPRPNAGPVAWWLDRKSTVDTSWIGTIVGSLGDGFTT